MKKQVDKSHYEFSAYVDKKRWVSMWHQLDEVLKMKPKRVLEIGPGPGIFKAVASSVGIIVETLDIDPELNPDHVASVFDMPFEDNSFDVVCAFQILEHIPFEKTLEAFQSMVRVAKTGVVISLPDEKKLWPMTIYIPVLGEVHFSIPRPRLWSNVHVFDGEHYWGINSHGYSLAKIIKHFVARGWNLRNTFRVHECPYHRFFIFIAGN